MRLWAKADVVKLLDDAIYKEIHFLPSKREKISVDDWEHLGFDNFNDDLQTEFWLVRASRSMPELALLKSIFTPEVRADLSRILHRIEYDIDTENSVKLFWRIFDVEKLFTDYVAAFIRSVVVHREHFYRNMQKFSARSELEEIIEEAESLYDFDNGDRFH